ncbi:MAG: hypothetical protein ACREJ2_18435 [Planctomycetota bacterium]
MSDFDPSRTGNPAVAAGQPGAQTPAGGMPAASMAAAATVALPDRAPGSGGSALEQGRVTLGPALPAQSAGTVLVEQLHAQCLTCDPKTVANAKVKVLKRAQLIAFLENALRASQAAAAQSAQAAQTLRDGGARAAQLEAALAASQSRALAAEQAALAAQAEREQQQAENAQLRAELEQLRTERNQFQIDATALRNQLRQVEAELASLDALRLELANKDKVIKQKEVALTDAHQVLVEKGLQDVDVWVKKAEKLRATIDDYEFNEDFYHAFAMPDAQYLHRLLHDSESRAEALKRAIAAQPRGATQAATGPAMAMVQAQLDIAVRARRAIGDCERSVAEMNQGKGSVDRIVNLAVGIGAVQLFIELVRMLNFGLQMAMLGLKSPRG